MDVLARFVMATANLVQSNHIISLFVAYVKKWVGDFPHTRYLFLKEDLQLEMVKEEGPLSNNNYFNRLPSPPPLNSTWCYESLKGHCLPPLFTNVPKDLASHWTYMVLLYRKATYIHVEGRFITTLGEKNCPIKKITNYKVEGRHPGSLKCS